MNLIFGAILILSTVLLIFVNPNALLSSMLSGGEKALELTFKIAVVSAIWMGVFELLDKSGLNKKLSRMLKPANKWLFGPLPDKANEFISLNVSANILGMSGATTPMGICAVNELSKYANTEFATSMFFVINATSVQLIPSSVLALRTSMGSVNPASIILPTVLATLFSTVIGVALVFVFVKKN